MPAPALRTDRLLLRQWREGDRDAFAALNADTEVMAHFPKTLTRAESDAAAERIADGLRTQPFGLWAVEVAGGAGFIGFVGLAQPGFTAHFTPCHEIGWRLARRQWGRGYATEAARAVCDYAFDALRLEALVSFTVPGNRRSRKVMERLGMGRDPAEDFEHPGLPEGDPLRRHVLYRLNREAWAGQRRAPSEAKS